MIEITTNLIMGNILAGGLIVEGAILGNLLEELKEIKNDKRKRTIRGT